jgi:glucose-6-phosphate isomerase
VKKTKEELWERFKKYYVEFPEAKLALDISRVDFPDDYFDSMEPRMQKVYHAMDQLEKGAIANPDEGRMVGHYWLRNPALAPSDDIRKEIEDTVTNIENFAAEIHNGSIRSPGGAFTNLLLIGIGGSALGPQFVSNALGHPTTDKLQLFVLDNTDPDGIDRVLAKIGEDLSRTLVVVISKSGRTKETRNGMLEVEAAFKRQNLTFSTQAVAVTGKGSDLDRYAETNHWLRRFPMWDWVGGRTSQMSAVGLLPAALQGFSISEMLKGANMMDEITRRQTTKTNPSALLSVMWYYVGNGKGARDMVIVPYKDRLELLSRYLQQLVMESLGKELDVSGVVVNQGIAVYGNKGSTDQHAYIQQLRDGLDNFFITFLQVLKERDAMVLFVEPEATSGDFLSGFFLGTRTALGENGKQSITIKVDEVSAFTVGALIALYERAVGFYATLIDVNAYHQPGVEAGKRAAEELLGLQRKVLSFLQNGEDRDFGIEEISAGIGADDVESIFHICQYLSANPERGVQAVNGVRPFGVRYKSA